ncbi:hypothetical protein ACFP51_22505 [Streptomyces pratens]|uniref:Uncharacterized protein n=1 Tax=Streptomyces pratens TaxID=887456 RepID=A0ABW1MAW1_9ACTN
MTILESIRQPRDLKALSEAELGELSEEIGEFPDRVGVTGVDGPADIGLTPVEIAGRIGASRAGGQERQSPGEPSEKQREQQS